MILTSDMYVPVIRWRMGEYSDAGDVVDAAQMLHVLRHNRLDHGVVLVVILYTSGLDTHLRDGARITT